MSIWKMIYGDTEEAMIKELKSDLWVPMLKQLRDSGVSQRELAEKLQISQPRMSNLMQGHLDKFSVEALLKIRFRLGAEEE